MCVLWILNIIIASIVISPEKAIQPINGGNAPGIAPTKTAMGPILLSGV